jgi:PKD repeat protein
MKTSRIIRKYFILLCMALMALTSVGIMNEAHASVGNMNEDDDPTISIFWYKGPWFIYTNAYNMHVLLETDKDVSAYIENNDRGDGCVEPIWERSYEVIQIGGFHRDRKLWTWKASNLTPNCLYNVTLKGGFVSKTGKFWTAPDGNVGDIGFFAFGDQKYISDTDEINLIAERITQSPFSKTFILHTGDMVYQGGYQLEDKDYWQNYFKINGMRDLLSTMPMFTTPGNHDVDKGDGSNNINFVNYSRYFPYNHDPGNYWYHRTYGPVQIYSLTSYPMDTNSYCSDTNANYRPYMEHGTGQYEWLVESFKYHDGDPRQWKIVIMHTPLYSPDDCNNQYDARKYLQPLFEEYGVDLILAGHEHYYARKTVNGIPYLILGGAGAGLSLPPDSPCRGDPQCKGFDYVVNRHHWAYFKINGDVMTVVVVDENNHAFDSFTVDRTPKPDFDVAPAKGAFPLKVKFTDKSTGNQYKYIWYFDDGEDSKQRYGHDASIEHTYKKEGTYSPKLRIWSGFNKVAKTCHYCVKVGPQAEFDGAPLVGALPLTVQFEDRSEGAVSEWSWEFGDGNTSTEQNPAHIYNENGKHTVSLTVSYNDISNRMTKTDYVKGEPYADFSYEWVPAGGTAGRVYFTSNSQGDSLTYHWDYGDGDTSSEESPIHTYANEGDRATLTVTDRYGSTDHTSKYISQKGGVPSPPETIEIDIMPEDDSNVIEISNKGWLSPEVIPVAILSDASFDASGLDTDTITFGRTGNEASLVNCDKELRDVNGDGYRDLVCHFEARQTGFRIGDDEGILRGMTTDGRLMEGKDYVQVKEFQDPIHR